MPTDPTAPPPCTARGVARDHHAPRNRIGGLRWVPATELLDHPKNWRRHPDAQRAALRALQDRVGTVDALIASEGPEGLVLIDGHLRRDLNPHATLPVLVVDLDPEEADLVLASLDPLAGMAGADQEALASLLQDMVVPEEVLEELQREFLRGLRASGGADPEDVPERPESPTVKPGELWGLGPHRLLCGDARSPGDLGRVMGEDRGDVLWTDPPYGVAYTGKTKDALTIRNDHGAGLGPLLRESFAASDAVLRPGAALYVCHPAGPLLLTFVQAFCLLGWRLHQDLVWVKDRMVLSHADYQYRHEPILYGYKPGRGRRGRGRGGWYGGNDEDSVFEVPRPAASPDHPTQKPVELVRRCLENSSRVGAVVLDPFAGSGSTLIACEELGRRARVVELDPSYCDVILTRWERFTGREAVRLDG